MATNEPLQVLFLEDNPADVKLLVHELEGAGFELEWQRADSEESCLSCLDPSLDLIFSDSSMPGFAATRALDLLQERGLDIPLIVVSGSLSDECAMEIMKHGAADYLLKDRLARLGQAVNLVLEKKASVCKVRQAEQRFLNVLESSPDALAVIDPDGRILLVNRRTEMMFGYRREELLGSSIEILLPARFRDTHVRRCEFLADNPGAKGGGMEMYGRRKDGKEFPVEISLGPLETDDGLRTICTIRDITEQRKIESELRQAQKLEVLGQLAGGVAHDFNNLLTVINGYTSVLLQQLPPEDPMRSLVEVILHAGERSAALTHQLLVFSRQQDLSPQELNLGSVVADIDKMLRRLIGEDVQLHVVGDPRLWPTWADQGSIEQVVLNLAVNARDAMPKGGSLTIETSNHDSLGTSHSRYVLLSVADTGIGMDEITKSRIFEPFFTTKGEKGSGLGLATVCRIVKQSGGYIKIESEPGRGTSFKLYFPAMSGSSGSVRPAIDRTPAPGGLETILLVEDDDGVRAVIRRILEGYGYTLLEAAKAHDAIATAARHSGPIHLLVTDVVMPELGGKEVADCVLAVHPETQVLFLSGYTDDAIERHGVHSAGTAFLHKPFTSDALAERIRQILDP